MAIRNGMGLRLLLLACVCWPLPGLGQVALCLDAIRQVTRETTVPEAVLLAVARIESGRGGAEPLAAWPWAVNQAGASRWFSSAAQAEAHVIAALAAGEENIDIGCFQVNHRWHGEAFPSVARMFDPLTNARYAARFLQDLFAETPDWGIAAGKYHSRTPELAEAYRTRFHAALGATHSTSGQSGPAAAPPRRHPNSYPLLQGGPAGVRGSTVPAVTGIGSLFFLQAKRIIGD